MIFNLSRFYKSTNGADNDQLGLIRFQGKDDSAVATAGDEWEIECHGAYEETENSSSHGTTKMTRTNPIKLYKRSISRP